MTHPYKPKRHADLSMPLVPEPAKDFLTAREAADILKVSKRLFESIVSDGDLQPTRSGMYRRKDVECLVAIRELRKLPIVSVPARVLKGGL